MYFEINVSHEGQHFFATAERSIFTEVKARKLYALLREKFPETEGYSITVSRRELTGTYLNFDF